MLGIERRELVAAEAGDQVRPTDGLVALQGSRPDTGRDCVLQPVLEVLADRVLPCLNREAIRPRPEGLLELPVGLGPGFP